MPDSWRLGVDTLTIRHPKLQQPVEIPLIAIAKVIAGPGPEVCRRTTIPGGIDPKAATLVLVLATPVTVRVRGALGREVSEIALAAADPAQAIIALSRLRVEPPAPATAKQLRDAQPLRVALGVVAPLVIVAAMLFAIQYGVRQVFPQPAGADTNAADEYAEAEKTEGRSRLPDIPSVAGATSWRARAEDGSLLYAWRTDDRLRVRVDTAPYDCREAGWREWWESADRGTIPISPDGHFLSAKRKVEPVRAGGVDVLTTWIQGQVRSDGLELRFTRQDSYRTAVGDGNCHRVESFSARRSG